MAYSGYVRCPTIYQDTIVFVAEDDLWLVDSHGGRAERLTAGVAEITTPSFSPNGQQLAFLSRAEGSNDVYVMPSLGDEARRLTFQTWQSNIACWSPGGESILFASSAGQFDIDAQFLSAISPQGGLPERLPYGRANALTYGPQGGVVIGRNIGQPAYWKRYRGGRIGQLWCDLAGDGQFQRLQPVEGNLASPCWIGERLYFVSDHEGIGNIYSCLLTGKDMRCHTAHQDFYARNLKSDGKRIVYHTGGDLYLFDPATDEVRHVEVSLSSSRTQRSRKFVSASFYLDTYALHPQGSATALTTRGKAFAMGNWEGPVLQYGEQDGVRYRHLSWLHDGKRLIAVHDAGGQEGLILFHPEGASEPQTFPDLDLGLVLSVAVSPTEEKVALANHRQELLLVDLATGERRILDTSRYAAIGGIAWSLDGKWLAYSVALSEQRTAIKLCKLESGETFFVTEPALDDWAPAFDPEGKYLYFLGKRLFTPAYDNLAFDLHFPGGVKPYAILLQHDVRSPFLPEPRAPGEKNGNAKKARGDANGGYTGSAHAPRNNGETNEPTSLPDLVINLEGITERAVPFPVAEGQYVGVAGLKGKVLFQSLALESSMQQSPDDSQPRGKIECFDFETLKVEWSIEGVSSFALSQDAKTLIYQKTNRLRVLKASEKPKDNNEQASRESGWLDLERVKVSIQPAAEWRQMFAEAWRLQREYFWAEDMAGIDWQAIYASYAPLVERVGSREELSDLFWELQGELCTSHAYESGGEYRPRPSYRQGYLGVDWAYDATEDRYRIARIVKGDSSNPHLTSPLTAPGLNVQVGDAVLAINGQRLSAVRPPQSALVNQANQEVQLTIEAAGSKEIRTIIAKTLDNERPARYREWVEDNRALVYQLSDRQIGYIHIPNMSASGFAEFHRSYLIEYDASGLIVDVRWNGGGSVSGLLLEKLARRRLGYRFSRWREARGYPYESPRGPMVALTNEHAGSDGDKFSHSFKLLGLGPLIGTRTRGGTIGLAGYHRRLVDGTRTTQPECVNWFYDVGKDLENHGAEPDIEVEITPQDYARQRDSQLERAVEECLRLIEQTARVKKPDIQAPEDPRAWPI
jgi:tricorn protease